MSTPTSRGPLDAPDDEGSPAPVERTDTGQHAAPRPYPPSAPTGSASDPEDPDTPGTSGTAAAGSTAATTTDAAAGPVLPAEPVVPVAPAATDRPASDQPEQPGTQTRVESRRDLEPPPRPGIGRHLLGVLLGLLLTPVALLVVGIGTVQLADVVGGTASAGSDALGVTLLVIGILLLAVVVLLGVWSPAVPLTGGLVWGLALGIAYLVVPDVMDEAVDTITGSRGVPGPIVELTATAMSGQLLVTGTLLVAAGLATAIARRAGRRWAEAVAAVEIARLEQGARTRT